MACGGDEPASAPTDSMPQENTRSTQAQAQAQAQKTENKNEFKRGKKPYHHQVIELFDGYVSGDHFYDPMYKVTFKKIKMHRYTEAKEPRSQNTTSAHQQSSTQENNSKSNNPLPIPRQDKNPEKQFGSFRISGPDMDFMPGQHFIFPKGVSVLSEDGTSIEADHAVIWTEEKINAEGKTIKTHTFYLEGHVTFKNDQWQITFKSLVLNDQHEGIGWSPRLIARNPKGLLGLGRGTNVKAILKARMLRFTPKKELKYFEKKPEKRKLYEVDQGEAHMGDFISFSLADKYETSFYDFFAGFKAGRNSRHGIFLKSRINLFEDNISFGNNGGIRARILANENWYEQRGFGHGVEGRYLMKFGQAEARGTLNFLTIFDKDRERRSTPYSDKNRFFGRWTHRGHVGNTWDWNFELSRESDPDVRDQFDRKRARREKPYQNRIYLAHKGTHHRLSVLGQVRSEDFVEEIDYMPRVQLDQLQIPFWDYFILEGHVQVANARLNEAEVLHAEAPSQRTQRFDVFEKVSMPLELFQTNVEPYVVGSSTLYNRRLGHRSTTNRTQRGVGTVLSSRYTDGVYRFLPMIDARKMYNPSIRRNELPQVDEIDNRRAMDTIDFDWNFLMRGKRFGRKFDIWNFRTHITGFPNKKRDNDGRRWSLLEKRLDIQPHPNFQAYAESKFDPYDFKYTELNTGFTINPDSRVEIGTGSNGREIFTANLNNPSQGRGTRSEWSYSSELRYTDGNPSIVIHQLDLIPRDKWRVSYAQEWEHDAGAKLILHRLKVDRDLRVWTLSFDFEWDREVNSSSVSVNLTPHNFGKF